ncbi:hypothetical protein DH2020_007578 [Rehmannia glutinosa]|uniref:Cyclin-like domain-containing protein n=1 Tax=Rehmannia glutinosa TaxID=99300 RepID=A0ABR0TYJ1_REHGL
MARHMPGNPSHHKVLENATCTYSQEEPLSFKPKWYFTKEEIEEHSPSRKDGIDRQYESHLRQLYCSYLQELGMELKVPQLTIATAMMLCHRFYMRQSHAKNHWQAVLLSHRKYANISDLNCYSFSDAHDAIISVRVILQTAANACMFLASKAEDTPCWLKDLIVVAYKLMYKWDPLAPQKIRQKEVYDKQKQLILLGEQLILVTVAFDLNIEHPYKPLIAALKKLEISQKELVKVAWNFVNDWLRTTLCLQYKPHYIAAGSLFLAAKFKKIKLPSANGKVWWMQFDVSPKQLEEVIQSMLQLLGQSSTQAIPASIPASSEANSEIKSAAVKKKHSSSELCISSGSMFTKDSSNLTMETASMISKPAVVKCNQKRPNNDTVKTTENCLSDSSSANSAVEDGDVELITGDSNQKSGCKIVSVKESCPKIDITKIRERLKRRKLDRVENKKSGDNLEGEISGDAWIEREIENGIELVSALS